ncbi:MAG TPA: SHOCT domain-containing protein [Pseudonocardia sp.]|uniref:SHOCT domain-containing protein n=1 Tax=Pseudonocardia sp. TaxID=60912 RepID=UPI002C44BE49|nr:SHOCT domain-containing protein [Pseudonocardia sp.]HTF53412.1 SHOCT domain-containing protein [Pseudonocardia sp.]
MKATITPEAENAIADIAQRYGLSRESVLAMFFAVNAGGGTMAQFSIPELGGSGQWMRGGMTMVGNMFDNALKARVDALCGELAQLLATTPVFPASTTDYQVGFTSANWWPADLGVPSASGGQNDARYAIFPSTQRLAIQINGVTKVFDTGKHHIGGVQQQQGTGYGSASFTSQLGTFDVSSLPELGAQQVAETPTAAPAPRNQPDPAPRSAPQAQAPEPASGASGDSATIVADIESLAGLHQRGILSDEEFATKKAELLGRL